MPSSLTAQSREIKKVQVEEVVLFAMNNIPQVDRTTLKQFLELVNTGGTFGALSQQQILKKMALLMKHVPNSCARSLLVLLDLLEVEPPPRLALLNGPQPGWPQEETATRNNLAFFIQAPETVPAGANGAY